MLVVQLSVKTDFQVKNTSQGVFCQLNGFKSLAAKKAELTKRRTHPFFVSLWIKEQKRA